jgi:GntR family transcriptional regulator
MIIVVDPGSGVPVYRQVMDQVRFHVASGLLTAGDELPPTRTLSAELGVNPMTVSKAYNLLEREGVLERRPGRPLVVRAMPPSQLAGQRTDRLRDSLTDAVRVARQLGVESAVAVELFREMLNHQSEEDR